METLAVAAMLADMSGVLDNIWNVLCVVMGLGLVIFFHELGHFAVAKWCDVNVQRFSIGFGPILWSRQRGETEYALSAIPFGGYVKMLGQDDMDASQMTDEAVLRDPRSYAAKKVWQRMAIISAGVIMNIITACLFFMLAYGLGVFENPPVVGDALVGAPAWEQGLRLGDEITHINGDEVPTFADIKMGIALSSGDLSIQGKKANGDEFDLKVTPDTSGSLPQIGINPVMNVKVIRPTEEGSPVTFPDLPAAAADPPLLAGDTILSLDGEELKSFAQLKAYLARNADKPVKFGLQRYAEEGEGEVVETVVGAQRFRSLGLSMEIGTVAAIQNNGPASQGGLKIGDTIKSVNGEQVGVDINPTFLPHYLAKLAGQEIDLTVRRKVDGSGDTDVKITLTPEDRPGWVKRPGALNEPLELGAIGAGIHVTTRVAAVEEGSEAAELDIQPGDTVTKVELIRTSDTEDSFPKQNYAIDFEPEDEALADVPMNWAYAYGYVQLAPKRKVVLHFRRGDSTFAKSLVKLEEEEEMYLAFRGFSTELDQFMLKAGSATEAISMGFYATKKNILQIYLTLRALFSGRVSAKNLQGPLGIARVGYLVAEQGISKLLLFLGFLSVNLAVLNFLPIPVLDGGHMVFLIYEAVSGKRPGPKILNAAQVVGLVFILGLMVFVLGQDVQRLMSGNGP